ncbi:helix-turn-helix domain-containing protein [Infirmifilum lucidum]|uniref:Helix-turn-helix domain-containing protein n=1 Tax=Infirmifilum lucidum TaxID=2776706 RepID=A0A7L9FIR5_9CREN|nr:sigma factor-like helix-turn-helix DNA-binding protein [Infirmifilum lucidum]QOJ79659.1 helix-turn-helix domain-containing protein [Infirmifilum lucidum]
MTVEFEKILSELTDTERRIVEYFLRNGGSAKDIASALNVSERTVYKALYKYRKLARENGIDPSAFYLRGTLQPASLPPIREPVVAPDHTRRDLIDRIKKEVLKEITEVLERSVREAVLSAFEELFIASEPNLKPVTAPKYTAVFANSGPSVALFERLVENLERLNYNFESLSKKLELIQRVNTSYASPQEPAIRDKSPSPLDNALPSFVKDNPWIEVLQRKYMPR